MSKLYISAGHGGKDPGAVKGSRREKDYNLPIALAVISLLQAAGHTVYTDRTTDKDSKLADKIKQANDLKVDAVFEIHLNAGGGTGCEVYYTRYGGIGKTLAENICKEIAKLNYRNRGAKIKKNALGQDYFGIIRQTKAPANLIECCFIDNDSDMARLNVQGMAQAIVAGILSVYPAVIKTPPVAPQAPSQGYKIGDKITVKNARLHMNSAGQSPGKTVSGDYFVTAVNEGAKYPVNIGKKAGEFLGWIDTAKGAAAQPLKVGDTVNFTGGKHYVASTLNVSVGGNRKAGKAKITAINPKGKHPYHVIGQGTCNVYGWVDKAQIGG